MDKQKHGPLNRLKHHVTGAIERGEKTAIVGIKACEPFHEYIKGLRIKAGLSQSHVAIELKYTSPQFVSNWERGLSMSPPKAIKTLERIYKVKPRKLLNRYCMAVVNGIERKYQQ